MLGSNDNNLKQQAVITILILLGMIITMQIVVMQMTESYKENMMTHDAEIAGHLLSHGVNTHQIRMAFTDQKVDEAVINGAALLKTAGYQEGMANSLLPKVDQFYQKYAVIMLVFTSVFSLFLLAVFYFFAFQRNKKLEDAGKKIQRFMDGDASIRLNDGGEDELSVFFSKVNTMATALTVHIEKEKHHRIFLKETISDISHQLKTPLAALQMYNEIILDEKTGNKVVEDFVQKSQRELLRMENLIQNLLKLAKIDAGTIVLEKNSRELKPFLEECRIVLMTRAERENKKINLVCDPSIRMSFDEIWLGEALENIIKNALDHTKETDQIEICGVENSLLIEITIKDNGAGIDPEDIHHIFERFYRSRYSKDHQGIGIGLALSKTIIEKHGGTITVYSELGKGTVFHVIFPKLTNL
ncbi:sensor histidine kinase [Acetobacterium carbinolicum]|jgi:Signal transduction histidine kinase|uniref:sensor histidine kinase n=1 Tax=Acetobacterium TaxID=33951 RepID=UPI001FA868F6|nr:MULTISPECIES: HAMP domain-containing sensor histidine kinase [unclassified Acetobacterium]MDZ5725637.1 HAMP domain-containing sensor histidine kinase [Acetobacterium sp. K1/6]